MLKNILPSEGKHMPSEGEHMPSKGEYIPSEGEHMPSEGEHITSEGEHTASEGEHIPSDEHTSSEGEKTRKIFSECYLEFDVYQDYDGQNLGVLSHGFLDILKFRRKITLKFHE